MVYLDHKTEHLAKIFTGMKDNSPKPRNYPKPGNFIKK